MDSDFDFSKNRRIRVELDFVFFKNCRIRAESVFLNLLTFGIGADSDI